VNGSASHGDEEVTVAALERVDGAVIDAFARLIPQLSRSAPPPGGPELEAMVGAPGTTLLVARDGTGRLIGTLTLVVFRAPTGVRAWIEDVVVDADARGKGVGAALTSEAMRLAVDAGVRTVDLTSSPAREAANRLYRRLGFEARATNVYRYTLG
jgi:ribosomal protein S18 acetylase RimI-like enzyme